jgi:DNA-binding MarR family transcriptional regulator
LFSNDRFKSLAIKADCTQNGRRSVEVTVPVRKTAQVDFVKTHFRTIWPVHLSAFSKLLRHLRDAFDGDLDQLLVLAAIAERTPASRWAPEVEDLKKTLLNLDVDLGPAPINMKSIADYTGIPRETVRRKIKSMERKGWVARRADGNITVEPGAASDLADATGYSIEYIAEILSAREAASAAGTG